MVYLWPDPNFLPYCMYHRPIIKVPPLRLKQTPRVMRVLVPRKPAPLSAVDSSSCVGASRPPALRTWVRTTNLWWLSSSWKLSFIFIKFFFLHCFNVCSVSTLILMFFPRLCKLWRPQPECQCTCVRYSRADWPCWPAVWLLWMIQLDVDEDSSEYWTHCHTIPFYF